MAHERSQPSMFQPMSSYIPSRPFIIQHAKLRLGPKNHPITFQPWPEVTFELHGLFLLYSPVTSSYGPHHLYVYRWVDIPIKSYGNVACTGNELFSGQQYLFNSNGCGRMRSFCGLVPLSFLVRLWHRKCGQYLFLIR